MTKDELFEKFWEESRLSMGLSPSLVRRKFHEIVAPHLAIPRSLKDDPPAPALFPARFIALKGDIASGYYGLGLAAAREKEFTHWIPFPDIPDKDEQEFKEWLAKYTHLSKEAWLAARGRK